MNKGAKIALGSIGGIVVLSGIFFGVKALIKEAKKNGTTPTPLPNPNNQNPPKNGNGSPEPTYEPGQDETTTIGGEGWPLKIGMRGDKIAKMQLALNKIFGGDRVDLITNACNPPIYWSYLQARMDDLIVDGIFGENTASTLAWAYDLCEAEKVYVCVCDDLKISEMKWNSIINEAGGVSDSELRSAGYTIQGSSNFAGRGRGQSRQAEGGGECPPHIKQRCTQDGCTGKCVPMGGNPPVYDCFDCPRTDSISIIDNGVSINKGYSNFVEGVNTDSLCSYNLPGYLPKQDTVFGSFYPNAREFVGDYNPNLASKEVNGCSLWNSYGMGNNHTFGAQDASAYVPFSGAEEGEYLSLTEYIDEVP